MRVVGYIAGAAIMLLALPVLLLGIGLTAVIRDGTGLEIPVRGLTAPPRAVAVVSPEFGLDPADIPEQLADADVLLRISPKAGEGPLFLGIAAAADLDRYLRNRPIARVEVDQPSQPPGPDAQPTTPDPQRVVSDGVDLRLVLEDGRRARAKPPGEQAFWTRSVALDGQREVPISLADLAGDESRIVLMRADGKAGIAADMDLRFRVPILRTIGWSVLAAGIVGVAIGAGLIVLLAVTGRGRGGGVAPAPIPTVPAAAAAPPAPTRPAVDTEPPDPPSPGTG